MTTAELTPNNDEEWWTPEDVHHFMTTWNEQGMPPIESIDATGANLWVAVTSTADIEACARRLELPVETFGGTPGIEFERRGYEVRVVVA